METAEYVIEAQIFPEVFHYLDSDDDNVARISASLIKEICKHSVEVNWDSHIKTSKKTRNYKIIFCIQFSQLVANSGGIEFLIEMLMTKKCLISLPAITALGYIAGHSDQLAWTVIEMKVYTILNSIQKLLSKHNSSSKSTNAISASVSQLLISILGYQPFVWVRIHSKKVIITFTSISWGKYDLLIGRL